MVTADLPDPFEQLVAFGHRPDAKIRPVLLRVLVDLFVSKTHHSAAELQQFEEMMAHLLDEADEETRLSVAGALSKHPLTPPSLLERFVAQRNEVAAKVLAEASMDRRALNAAAVFGTAVMAQAVARRRDIDATVIRNLAERPETDVLCALVENRAAPIDRALLRYLARRSQVHPELAARLLERGDTGETVSLFMAAGRTQRADLIAAARRQDLGATGAPLPFTASPRTMAAIERAALTIGLDGLDAALATALGCTSREITRIIDDPHGEPLALALAALGVPAEVAARIFILGQTGIGHSYAKVRRLVEIVQTVSPRAAGRLIATMLGRSEEPVRRATGNETFEPVRRGESVHVKREVAAKPAARKFNWGG